LFGFVNLQRQDYLIAVHPVPWNLSSINKIFYYLNKKSPIIRGDFPIGMPSAIGVFIGFSHALINIPPKSPFVEGDLCVQNLTIELRFGP